MQEIRRWAGEIAWYRGKGDGKRYLVARVDVAVWATTSDVVSLLDLFSLLLPNEGVAGWLGEIGVDDDLQ